MIKVTCNCGATLNVKDEYAGKRGKCPRCGNGVQIPLLELEEDLDPFDSPFAGAFTPQSNASPRNDSISTNSRASSSPPPVAPQRANPQQNSFEEMNTFAAPQKSATDPTTHLTPVKKTPQLKVENSCIIGESPMTMPRYCIKCGEPIAPNEIETIKVIYTPPSVAIRSILRGSGAGMVISRKTCIVYAGLCSSHRKRRILNRVIFVLMLLVGLALSISPFFLYKNAKGSEGVPIGVTGLVLMIAAFFFLVLTNQLLSARKYDGDCSVDSTGKKVEGNFTIKGFCREFLAKIGT